MPRAYLLSPYRLPTGYPVTLSSSEAASFLNGLLALWHPAALRGADALPSAVSPYDHETPEAGAIYATPESPQLFLPVEWTDRIEAAGCARFTPQDGRAETLASLREAMRAKADANAEIRTLLELPDDKTAAFLAIGFGFHVLDALFEAMDHEKQLDIDEFRNDINAAIDSLLGGGDGQEELRRAAQRLVSAREVLYPVTVHVLDFAAVSDDGSLTPPAAFGMEMPVNLIASGQELLALRERDPNLLAVLRERLNPNEEAAKLEVCCGAAIERDDALLPMESQLWNLREGQRIAEEVLGKPSEVLARRRSSYHVGTPQLMLAAGLKRAVMLNLDGATLPVFRSSVVNWSGADGRSVDVFARTPLAADEVSSYFNLATHLHTTLREDTTPTIALMHKAGEEPPFYRDWLTLTQLAPALGDWKTVTQYLDEAPPGEYAGAVNADDYFCDDLDRLVTAGISDPVSRYAKLARDRRLIDGADTFESLLAMLGGSGDSSTDEKARSAVREVENASELSAFDPSALPLTETPQTRFDAASQRLAARLQAKSGEGRPGCLVLNPCSYARRVPVGLPDMEGYLPIEGPIKSFQNDNGVGRAVVEVPPLGFLWLSRRGANTPTKSKLKTADGNSVRNEFLEVETDPATGGMRAIRDLRTRINRLAQQLIYQPGSKMVSTAPPIILSGPALGEITTTGEIQGDDGAALARFKQRFRVWAGRPAADVRIELDVVRPARGYGWHGYFGSRFAWRDERATSMRGLMSGGSSQTTHSRPVSGSYFEIPPGRE